MTSAASRPTDSGGWRDLNSELPLVDDQVVGRQAVGWRPDAWIDHWERNSLPRREVLDLITAEFFDHGTIRRDFIQDLDDPMALFIASMAWGYGDDGRGPYRAGRMLQTPRGAVGAETAITDIVDTTRRRGASAGFGSLFNAGRTRVFGLGIAFGTKLLHFAGYREHPDAPPLVLDVNVWRGSMELKSRPPVPDPRRYTTSAAYESYCRWAAQAGIGSARAVEYVLFRDGQGRWPSASEKSRNDGWAYPPARE